MNIKLSTQHLRCRLDERDVARLLAGSPILFQCNALRSLCFEIQLQETTPELLSLTQENALVRLSVRKDAFLEFHARLPQRHGLTAEYKDINGEPIRLTLDVDLRKIPS